MALAAQLALEIPERQIDGVAGGAGRQQGLQPLAVEPVGERPVQALDLAEHALHRFAVARIGHRLAARSEEHTSELQSLMRISYAVFCLKKKKPNTETKQ